METKTDVKHILVSLEKGSATMAGLDARVDTLEKAEATRAENKAENKTLKDRRMTIISLLIGAAGVIVAAWAIVSGGKTPP